jgi:site-specific recombinase XerC
VAEPLLPDLLESWEIILLAENKSPTTISSYLRGVRLYLQWCEQAGRAQVQAYMAELIADGKEANTVRLRQASLRQFVRWLVDEGELPEDPLLGLKAPKIPTKVVHALTDDQLRALIRACKGPTFRDKRDEAIVRLMSDTGMRAAETLALTVADVQPLKEGSVTIHRGKGMRGRRRRLPQRWTNTYAPASPTSLPARPRCGWARTATASPISA